MSAAACGMRGARTDRRVVRGDGFTLLELAVCVAVLMTLAGVLLMRLHYYQEAAERADMEYTANTLKLALQLRVSRDHGQQRPVNHAEVMGENPVGWLEQPMKGYRGEVGQAQAELLPGGSWYFDRERRELVYLPLRDSHLLLDSEGRKAIRFQVRVVRAQAGERKDDAAVLGLQLSPVEQYRWR